MLELAVGADVLELHAVAVSATAVAAAAANRARRLALDIPVKICCMATG
jgi:hypothetical protein